MVSINSLNLASSIVTPRRSNLLANTCHRVINLSFLALLYMVSHDKINNSMGGYFLSNLLHSNNRKYITPLIQ